MLMRRAPERFLTAHTLKNRENKNNSRAAPHPAAAVPSLRPPALTCYLHTLGVVSGIALTCHDDGDGRPVFKPNRRSCAEQAVQSGLNHLIEIAFQEREDHLGNSPHGNGEEFSLRPAAHWLLANPHTQLAHKRGARGPNPPQKSAVYDSSNPNYSRPL